MIKFKQEENNEESSENKLADHGDVSLALEEIIPSVEDNLPSRPRSWSETESPSSDQVQGQVDRTVDTQDPGSTRVSLLTNKRSKRFQQGLNTKLLKAIKRKDGHEVKSLLEQGANPNVTCHSEYILACQLVAPAGGEALSLLHADRMRYDLLGKTPLHFAAWEGNIAQVALLLRIHEKMRGKINHPLSQDVLEDIRANNKQFQTLANTRCVLDEVIPECSDASEDIKGKNCFTTESNLPLIHVGWTPLHAASANARDECVRLLLAAGSDPNARDDEGRSPLDVVGTTHYNGREINPNNFANVIRLLVEANPTRRNMHQLILSYTPLHTAVELESIEAIKDLLAAGASACSLNRDGLTPLHLCVKKKLQEHLQILINNDIHKYAVTSAMDRNGRTVLHAAVLSNWIPGVRIALAEKADPLALARDGESPFHLAAALGNLDILNEILFFTDVKNNINFRNKDEKSPLFKAVENGHTECVMKLLKCGASVQVTTPVRINVLRANPKKILKSRAAVTLAACERVNVFHVAAKKGYIDVLKLLVDDNYADTRDLMNSQINYCGYGFAPIHFAVWYNHPECVKLLLTKNVSINMMNSNGDNMLYTPLHLAAARNNLEIAKILIEFNPATIHEVDYLGLTPLHTASQNASRDVILYLLKKSANLATTTGKHKLTRTSVELIMKNMSKPTEFIEEVFDSYIHDNNLNLHDPNYEVTVDYSILLPDSKDTIPDNIKPKTYNIGQLTVIQAIIGSGNRQKQNRLLLHPLIESFLWLKWRALMPYFWFMVIVYSTFAISFTGFILSTFMVNDTNGNIPCASNANNTNGTSFNISNSNYTNGQRPYGTSFNTSNVNDTNGTTFNTPNVNGRSGTSFYTTNVNDTNGTSFNTSNFNYTNGQRPYGTSFNTSNLNDTNGTSFITSNVNGKNGTSFHSSNANNTTGITPYTSASTIWLRILMCPLSLLVMQEIFYYKFSKEYLRQLESWVKLCIIQLTSYLIIYHDTPDSIMYRNAAALAMLLSWMELMFLLSGSPTYGYYVPMFRKVSWNMIKVLLTFGFIIIGFSLSFLIEFHAQDPFEDGFAAIVKTMVMMTSEFDYEGLIGKIKENEELAPFLIPVRIVFVGFLIFTAIVLMNLMIGVAVNDLQNLEFRGNIMKTKKQVEFLAFLENVKKCMRLNRLIASCLHKKKSVKKNIILRPNGQSCEYYNKLPAHIRDSIFDIALKHKRSTDEELGTKTYNTKLDKIYKAIVNKSKEDEFCSPEWLVEVQPNKKYLKEKINTTQDMESLVTELKLQLDSNFKQTQNSIELLNKKINYIVNKLNM